MNMQHFSLGLTLAACALLTSAPAATVVWGAASTISGESDVSTVGELVQAYNFVASGTGNTTVNTVTFQNVSLGTDSGTPGVASHFITDTHGITPAIDSTSLATHFINQSPSSLSSAYSNLLANALVGRGTTTAGQLNGYTVTLENLVIGNNYQVQIWVNDSRNAGNSFNGNGILDGVVAVDYNNATTGTDGLGQFVTGEFTADQATQSFTFSGTNTGSPTSAYFAILNSYQLRDITAVPEPSLSLLGMLGLIVLITRRAA